ncbi:MAG: aldolase/citrate lyase family protein [Sphingorhabdus sp.]
MHFIFITEQPDIAEFACNRGVDWIMVDLEVLGKADRQGHLDTVMNSHSVGDVRKVRGAVPPGRLLVRTNPLHSGSAAELDGVIAAGADIVMLPYFHSASEAADYCRIVNGRAQVFLLAETRGAAADLPACCSIPGVARIHIGLNDLSLELERSFMFELLTDGTVAAMASQMRMAGMPFGIGGVARAGEGLLPAEGILAEHARLGSDAAILSRTFHRGAQTLSDIETSMNFALELQKLRDAYGAALAMDATALSKNALAIAAAVAEINARMHARSRPA